MFTDLNLLHDLVIFTEHAFEADLSILKTMKYLNGRGIREQIARLIDTNVFEDVIVDDLDRLELCSRQLWHVGESCDCNGFFYDFVLCRHSDLKYDFE